MKMPQETNSASQRVRPQADPWIRRLSRGSNPRLRLFCFSYAGGGLALFHAWPEYLPDWVDLCPILLPGREDRLREPPFDRMSPLIDSLSDAILPHLDLPFAFFGHSLGALIGFELARHIRRQQHVPAVLFVSGCEAPQCLSTRSPINRLPDDEFLQELHRLNGTPIEILENPELMQLLLPALRADFAMSEEYVYVPENPLGCAISAYGGSDDAEVRHKGLSAWQSQSQVAFRMRLFPGDHFFLHTARRSLLQAISQDLTAMLTLNTKSAIGTSARFIVAKSAS